jgi:hypothetical protein
MTPTPDAGFAIMVKRSTKTVTTITTTTTTTTVYKKSPRVRHPIYAKYLKGFFKRTHVSSQPTKKGKMERLWDPESLETDSAEDDGLPDQKEYDAEMKVDDEFEGDDYRKAQDDEEEDVVVRLEAQGRALVAQDKKKDESDAFEADGSLSGTSREVEEEAEEEEKKPTKKKKKGSRTKHV